MTTSWCDKLASTPSIGIGFEPFYTPTADMFGALSPLLTEWTDGKKEAFSITKNDPFLFEVHKNDGFVFGADPGKMYIEFRHKMKLRSVSGGYPQMEMLSKPAPYTELLPSVAKALVTMFGKIDPKGARKLSRIGVVSLTFVNAGDAPPGIAKFIKLISKPWPKGNEGCSVVVTGVIRETEAFKDRCIHNISVNQDDADILNINLDYQRIYKKPSSANSDRIAGLLSEVSKTAIEYFEEVAEGSIFDADLN